MRKLSTIIAFILISTSIISAQTQTAWNFNTNSNSPSGVQAGMTAEDAIFSIGTPSFVTGFDIGNPPTYFGGSAYASNGWTTNATYNSSDYFELEVNTTGANLDFQGLELVVRKAANGPQKVAVTTSVDGHASVLHTINLTTDDFNAVNINLSSAMFSNLSGLVVRFHGYDAGSSTGLLVFDEIAFNLLSVVPVELAYFDGNLENNSTVLDWSTYSEENNAYFEVMHSTDGIGFKTIDRIEGAGTTVEQIDYQYIHENPENGTNYYRLRQVDFDGTKHYTNIITVEHQTITTADIKVFPNPTVDYVNIQLPQNDVSTDIMIYNINGQIMQTINNVYDNNLELNVSDWLSGQYVVILQQGNQRVTKQFVKF